MELGPKLDKFVESLLTAVSKFCTAAGIKSAAGRTLFGCEIYLGLILLVAFAMVLAHEVFAAIYSWARGMPFEFHTERSFGILAAVMVFSFLLVFCREMFQPNRN